MGLDPEHWVDDYGDFLFRFAFARVNNKHTAEDLVQETLLSALKNISEFKNKSQERTWLISILKHKIIDYYRKRKDHYSLDEMNAIGSAPDFKREGAQKGHWREEFGPKNWESNPHQQIERQEIRQAILKCIGKLPEKWALLFRMREMDDVPNEEICQVLDISSSNLWVILHRARLLLRRCLEKLLALGRKRN